MSRSARRARRRPRPAADGVVNAKPGVADANGTYVLTNDHIAAGAPELRVVLPDGTEVGAEACAAAMPSLDLALLALDPSVPEVAHLKALPLGSSDGLQVGEAVVVLGDAFGDDITATAGIVSSTGHDSAGSIVVGGAMSFRTFLQLDARVHRGNSGGPVLDTAGQVVGIAVATSDRASELSFAIPIDRAREILLAMRDRGGVARSWLGVKVIPMTPGLALTVGLVGRSGKPHGAFVTELEADSPAARASLRPGDVILAWGEREIDERTLPPVVAATPPGTAVTVEVWRSAALQQLKVVTEPMRR